MNQIFFLLLFFLAPVFAVGQENLLANAIRYYTEGKLTEAKTEIDKAVLDSSLIKDPKTWYAKGFIYKDLYKSNPESENSLALRVESVNAFKKLEKLDVAEEHKTDRLKSLNYLSATFYNDALYFIGEKNFELANTYFEQYKPTAVLAGWPDADIKGKEIEFYLNQADTYRGIYNKDKTKKNYFEKIKQLYEKVLVMNKDNFEANYNLGILYYNEAVDLVKPMDYDTNIEGIMEIESRTIALFEKSLPYMQSAYNLDPKNKNTVVGLSGIYFGLNEFEKSDAFKKILEELDKK